MYHSLLPLIGWAATLLVAAFAWWRGGPAERRGAVLIVGAAVAVYLSHFVLRDGGANLALLVIDAVMAGGFLALAIRHVSLWLGGAMLLQAAQFSLHAWYLVGDLPHNRFYAISNNLISAGILACILTGTIVVWTRRARTAQAV